MSEKENVFGHPHQGRSTLRFQKSLGQLNNMKNNSSIERFQMIVYLLFRLFFIWVQNAHLKETPIYFHFSKSTLKYVSAT